MAWDRGFSCAVLQLAQLPLLPVTRSCKLQVAADLLGHVVCDGRRCLLCDFGRFEHTGRR